MKHRVKLKKKLKIFKNNRKSLIILLIIFVMIYFFVLLNKRIFPVLLGYAESETTKMTMDFINNAISKEIKSNIEIEDILTTVLNKDGEIVSVDFNTKNINSILYSITSSIQSDVRNLENGKASLNQIKNSNKIYYIPTGLITGMPILGSIGPKIPLKINMVGNITSNIKTDVTNYGINNAMLKVYIQIHTKMKVVLPFVSKQSEISLDVPVAIKVVQGKTPQVYGGNFSTTSPLYGLNS